MIARVLAIGGSDSGAGAGIQADLKTVASLGGYATTALTAVTAQDTRGVHAVHPLPPAIVTAQLRAVLDDIGADAVKTGMLVDGAVIEAVAGALYGHPAPLVLDPVLVSSSGTALLDPDAMSVLVARLFPRARLITPNLPEAEALLGRRIAGEDAQAAAATALLAFGPGAVLLKGGHADGEIVTDMLATSSVVVRFSAPRLVSRHTHGTGCTLAAAIATRLAQGAALADAVVDARAYVRRAIAASPGIGGGHGPLQHWPPAEGDGP